MYSTTLFANQSIKVIEAHAQHHANKPLFLYLALQSVHSPLQAPKAYVDRYSWITNPKRRTLAAMSTCQDDELARVVKAAKGAGLWDNSVFAFVADNGGPPYVANSNWPMRGGKWTIWEGGTHLTGKSQCPSRSQSQSQFVWDEM